MSQAGVGIGQSGGLQSYVRSAIRSFQRITSAAARRQGGPRRSGPRANVAARAGPVLHILQHNVADVHDCRSSWDAPGSLG